MLPDAFRASAVTWLQYITKFIDCQYENAKFSDFGALHNLQGAILCIIQRMLLMRTNMMYTLI